ncbi:MAG TPA: hypothetical protein VMT17_15715 [Anaeromyxobacteraceae bacterium]|nr:hypothetical protein [Anaeromyxobacteraceae bacterium]
MLEGAHLVGSVPLASAEAVFRSVSSAVGDRLRTLPDGETGPRKDWIAWQYAVLASTPGLEPIPAGDRAYLRPQLVRVRRGDARGLRFGGLGYADAALASFAVFERLSGEGAIPASLRFQVSLPTPLAPITVFVRPEDRTVVEPAYEAQLLSELRRITEGIPGDRLAIQWDVAVEVGLLEGVFPAHFHDVADGIATRLARLGAAVPAGVELGYHLCYGDFGHRHFANPSDAGTLVRLAGSLLPRLSRPLAWLHVPVPVGWAAPAAYAPLSELRLPGEARLYLGLVHLEDGVDGARRRIGLARQAVTRFGVATECGWGRRPPATVPALLELHAALSGASA